MITIRDMRGEDRETYFRMARAFYSGPAALYPVTEEALGATLAECASPDALSRLLMIECGGEPAGYIDLSRTWSTEAGGLVIWIEELWVEPAYRRAGIGREALRAVLGMYPTARRFRLEVSPENQEVLKLYESVGFKPLKYDQLVIDR